MSQEILSLKRNTIDLDQVLINGSVMRHGERLLALPREVVPMTGTSDSILFELIRSRDVQRPLILRVWLRAIRPETLIMTLGPCIAALLYAFNQQWPLSELIAASSLLGAVFFQISVNALNDVEDHLRLIDLPGTLGGSGVIQKGWINAKSLRHFAYAVLGLGIGFGMPAVVSQPPVLFLIGGLGLIGVLAYSSKPWGMKYRPVGDLSIFVLLGPLLTLGFSLAISGHLDSTVAALGGFFGCLSWAVLHASNLQDIEFDRANGITTLAAWVGFKRSRFLLLGLYGLAYIFLLLGWGFGDLPAAVLLAEFLALPFLLRLAVSLFKASGPASALLGGIRYDSVRLHWVLSGLVNVALLWTAR